MTIFMAPESYDTAPLDRQTPAPGEKFPPACHTQAVRRLKKCAMGGDADDGVDASHGSGEGKMDRQNVKRCFAATALVTTLALAAGPAQAGGRTADRTRGSVAAVPAPQAREGAATFWGRLLSFLGMSLQGAIRAKRGAGIDPNGFEAEPPPPTDLFQITLTRRGAGIDPNG
jgi:hypothetical protein